jgi:hypothetical protein
MNKRFIQVRILNNSELNIYAIIFTLYIKKKIFQAIEINNRYETMSYSKVQEKQFKNIIEI